MFQPILYIDAALEVGVDYIILDGRGGGTGAAPVIFKDNISVPTIPALTRAQVLPWLLCKHYPSIECLDILRTVRTIHTR